MYLSWWPELWTWRSKEGQTIWGTLNWSTTTTWNDCCAHNCSFLKCKQETLKENNHAPSICPGWIISLVVWCIFYCLAYILCEGWWRAPTAKVPGSCWGSAVWDIWSPWRIKTSLPLWLEWSTAIDRSSVRQRFFYQEVFSSLGRSHWLRQVKLTGKED